MTDPGFGYKLAFPDFNDADENPSPNPAPDLSNKSFPCPDPTCGRSFTRNKALQDHLQGPAHVNEKPYKCKLCAKKFTRSNDLKRHEVEVHEEKKFVCEEILITGTRRGCLKRFSRATTLKQHQKECVKFRKPTQPEAQLTWPSVPENRMRQSAQSILQKQKQAEECRQEWVHEDLCFVCKVCKVRRLKSLVGSFVQHLICHLEDIEYRAFRCAQCPARFILQDHLNRHAITCQKLICGLSDDFNGAWGCGRRFESAEHFAKHMQGIDNTGCHGHEDKVKESIIRQLDSLGFTARKKEYTSFEIYISEVRGQALRGYL